MISFKPENVVDLVMQGFEGTEVPTYGEIHAQVDELLRGPLAGLRPQAPEIVDEILKRLNVRVGTATIMEDDSDHKPWLDAADRSGWRLWPRYVSYLRGVSRLAPAEISEVDRSSDLALSRLEMPSRTDNWDRRGLVVGHVQSGKTTNYTALIAKGIDAGYRVVIVLAGIHNSLRSQTQERIDSDLIGRNSKAPLDSAERARYGVALHSQTMGLEDPHFSLLTCTTAAENGDFNQTVAGQVWFQVSEGARLVLVVKKNATILRKLHGWLTKLLGEGKAELIQQPTLVIDDEADQASINTRDAPDEDTDPSKINGWIRKLLMSFPHVGYVAYTATPFANIFIDPSKDFDRNEFGPDLFPRSFIVNLKASDQYVGPELVFGHPGDEAAGIPERRALPMYERVADAERWIPAKHDKFHSPGPLPASLIRALRLFVLVCATRQVRGQVDVHNSMLIHATRLVLVQNKVKEQIAAFMDEQRSLLDHADPATVSALENEFREVWNTLVVERHAAFRERLEARCPALPEWGAVWAAVRRPARRIDVRSINGTSEDVLAYSENPKGIWVITIGGDRLSRGLTLAGLSVSYFLRASRMFDTLMQMGRWFGYRAGYVDLCRVFTTPELYRAFRDISLALEDMRSDFDRMVVANQIPEQFGLRVRTPSDGLLISAANKLRRGQPVSVRFAGELVQALTVARGGADAQESFKSLVGLIAGLGPGTDNVRGKPTHWPLWHGVGSAVVRGFLGSLHAYSTPSFLERCQALIKYIDERNGAGELVEWTVCLVCNRDGRVGEQTVNLGGRVVWPVTRSGDTEEGRFLMRAVVGSTEEMVDLSEGEYERALTRTNGRCARNGKAAKAVPDREDVRAERPPQRGLLLIYPIRTDGGSVVVSAGVSFPASPNAPALTYTVNEVWASQYGIELEPNE